MLSVCLHGERVGSILRDSASGIVSFVLDEAYAARGSRSVLGQQFEDRRRTLVFRQSAFPGRLPTFFANLLPEGAFRDSLTASHPVSDDLFLLMLLGQDLPGAVVVGPLESSPAIANGADAFDEPTVAPQGSPADIRFSLAGVQLKFSAIRDSEHRLAVAVHGRAGGWIVKLGSPSYPLLVENELATMRWAARCGIRVPTVDSIPTSELAGLDPRFLSLSDQAFVIERYDRRGTERVHQEDLAQVRGVPPELKYERWSYEGIARFLADLCGLEDLAEYLRRLVFIILSGNTDAHLKNWSVVYPDRITARLSPAYDLVFVRQYLSADLLALPLANEKDPTKITWDHFRRLQKFLARVGYDLPVVDDARTFVTRCLDEWQSMRGACFDAYRGSLDAYHSTLPIARAAPG